MSSESPPENLFKTEPSKEDRKWIPPNGMESFGRSRGFQRGRGDPVPEVGDYSVKNLCSFLETVLRKHYEFPEIDELWNKRVIILQNSQGRIVDPLEKKSVFHKVIESLPKPTLKESLMQATDYLCAKCEFKLLQNEHPEWPKNDSPSLTSVIRDETPDDLKELALKPEKVVRKLPSMGKQIMILKMRDLCRKRNLAYAAFFKKYPELFPWTNKTIIEGDKFIEGKDS